MSSPAICVADNLGPRVARLQGHPHNRFRFTDGRAGASTRAQGFLRATLRAARNASSFSRNCSSSPRSTGS